MNNRLQELTDKLYQEGISKSQTEADVILSKAKQEAQKIISEAQKEAKGLLSETKKQAKEMISHAKAELKLASGQAIDTLKQEITNLIGEKVVKEKLEENFKESDFIQKLIDDLIVNWASSDSKSMEVAITSKQEKQLKAYFSKQTKKLLDKGFTITPSSKLKSGFQIGPSDGSYKINFSDEDFYAFFEDFLREKTAELLFTK